MEDQQPFADVVIDGEGLSLPDLKWRELLFIGALRAEGAVYVRDLSRPMPPFQIPDPFPAEARFDARRQGARVHLKRV